jgi:hypothetical protein
MINQYKKHVDDMMQREVSRGDFLKFVGVGLLGITGIVGFIKQLNDHAPGQRTTKKRTAGSGYGHSAYGR